MARREGCVVHAYGLMTNHVHLLLTPLRPGAAQKETEGIKRKHA